MRANAAFIYMTGVWGGLCSFNPAHYSMAFGYLGVSYGTPGGVPALVPAMAGILMICAGILFVLVQAKRGKLFTITATDGGVSEAKRIEVPLYAVITPALPAIFFFLFGWPPMFSLIIALIYGFIATQPRSGRKLKDIWDLLYKSMADGLAVASPMLFIALVTGPVTYLANIPEVKNALGTVFSPVFPPAGNLILIWLFFVIIRHFAIYRGPGPMPYGIGALTFALLAATNILPTPVLACLAFPSVYEQLLDPCVTFNTWILGYTKVDPGTHFRLRYPIALIISVATTTFALLWPFY